MAGVPRPRLRPHQKAVEDAHHRGREKPARSGSAEIDGLPLSWCRAGYRRCIVELLWILRDEVSWTYKVQRKVFWTVLTVLGLITDVLLPLWWAIAAFIPVVAV